MSDDDKIIRFPGAKPVEQNPADDGEAAAPANPFAARAAETSDAGGDAMEATMAQMQALLQEAVSGWTDDQRKALHMLQSNMTFVMVGIQPTGSGADFFISIHGDRTALSNANPHLGKVISRALDKRGL